MHFPAASPLSPFSLPPSPTTTPIVVVCAWCPDKPERDAEALRLGYRVSHTICEACKEKQLADLTPDRLNPPQPIRFTCQLSPSPFSLPLSPLR